MRVAFGLLAVLVPTVAVAPFVTDGVDEVGCFEVGPPDHGGPADGYVLRDAETPAATRTGIVGPLAPAVG